MLNYTGYVCVATASPVSTLIWIELQRASTEGHIFRLLRRWLLTDKNSEKTKATGTFLFVNLCIRSTGFKFNVALQTVPSISISYLLLVTYSFVNRGVLETRRKTTAELV